MKGMQKFVPQQVQQAAAAAQEAAEDFDLDLNDPDLSKAATKIQASFRGHKTRKEVKDPPTTTDKQGINSASNAASNAVDETVDIDLTDPDLAKAATKIQASFRGYQTRREVKHP